MASEAVRQVCINQQSPAASIGAVKSALRSLRSGMPLVIFPEGGRTRDGTSNRFCPAPSSWRLKRRPISFRSR